jgi:hypothetical protein
MPPFRVGSLAISPPHALKHIEARFEQHKKKINFSGMQAAIPYFLKGVRVGKERG